ncbi:MAG: hypothetical protein OXM61_22295 [Candidatus Poribacteria bacterium]|nr:hypothetical protein [Candidatus Poribacteria bacterium]
MGIDYGGSAEALAFFIAGARVREWLLISADSVNKHILHERTYVITPVRAR